MLQTQSGKTVAGESSPAEDSADSAIDPAAELELLRRDVAAAEAQLRRAEAATRVGTPHVGVDREAAAKLNADEEEARARLEKHVTD